MPTTYPTLGETPRPAQSRHLVGEVPEDLLRYLAVSKGPAVEGALSDCPRLIGVLEEKPRSRTTWLPPGAIAAFATLSDTADDTWGTSVSWEPRRSLDLFAGTPVGAAAHPSMSHEYPSAGSAPREFHFSSVSPVRPRRRPALKLASRPGTPRDRRAQTPLLREQNCCTPSSMSPVGRRGDGTSILCSSHFGSRYDSPVCGNDYVRDGENRALDRSGYQGLGWPARSP